jgi:hypothetical protein
MSEEEQSIKKDLKPTAQFVKIFRTFSLKSAFHSFLRSHYCEENFLFFAAVEEYRKVSPFLNLSRTFQLIPNLSSCQITIPKESEELLNSYGTLISVKKVNLK